jgi:outer membrane protein assembly factor BamB
LPKIRCGTIFGTSILILLFVLSAAFVQFANSTSSSAVSSTSSNWLTYHKDLSRDGYDNSSNNSPPPSFAWESVALDGGVYAEPLVYNGFVIVATENNTVYSLNATTGTVVWSKHLGEPVPGDTLPCGDIDPSGITGTPAINPTSGILYVVAYLYPPQHHVLFGLNLKNGHVVFKKGVDPKGVSVLVEQQRAALAIANGLVYVPYGGLAGDCGQYHGYVVGVPENGSAKYQFKVPTQREGGIWGTSGASVDSLGDLFVATGNGASTTKFDFGDSVIELSPTLKKLAYFAPTNWAYLNGHDLDLGSVGPAILNNSGLIFQIGKEGVGYLLNMTNLGKIGGQLYNASVCPGGSSAFGGTALDDSVIFAPCTGGLVALLVNFAKATFKTLWDGPNFWAGPPIVSNNLVWTVNINNGKLFALSPVNGTTIFSYNMGSVRHFISPAASNGLIFVAADNELEAFNA